MSKVSCRKDSGKTSAGQRSPRDFTNVANCSSFSPSSFATASLKSASPVFVLACIAPRTATATCKRSASASARIACLNLFFDFSTRAKAASAADLTAAPLAVNLEANSARKLFNTSSCSPSSPFATFSTSPSAFSTCALAAATPFSTSSTVGRSCRRPFEPRVPATLLAFSTAVSPSPSSLSTSQAVSWTSTFLLSRSSALAMAFSIATIARKRWSLSKGTPASSPARLRRTFSTVSPLGSKLYSALAKAWSSSLFRKPSLSSSNLSKISRCALVAFSSAGLFRITTAAVFSSSIFFLQCLSFPGKAMNSKEPFVFIAASVLPISIIFWFSTLVADCTAEIAAFMAVSVACAASSAASCVTSLASGVSGARASTASLAFSSTFASSPKATLASASTLSGSGTPG
mmetsp:Transcript_102716/g.306847  ORF Transcript_102716/g.306847 Transcript_102716/m.306847 type:complete len:404 (-) Transcript_102716:334-1545(-)